MTNRHDFHHDDPSDDRDPVLDASLAEVLGGESPPDLSAQILAACAARQQIASQQIAPQQITEQPTARQQPIPLRPLPLNGVQANGAMGGASRLPPADGRNKSEAGRLKLAFWMPLALAAGLLLCVTGYFATRGLRSKPAPEPDLAQHQGTAQHEGAAQNQGKAQGKHASRHKGGVRDKALANEQDDGPSDRTVQPQIVDDPVEDDPDQALVQEGNRANPASPNEAQQEPKRGVQGDDGAHGELASSTGPGAGQTDQHPIASSDEEVIAYIDEYIRQQWTDAGVLASPAATDAEWCRRVYLDVIGRIPTVSETMRFASERSSDKKRELVMRLLDSDEYIEDYARNWTTLWTNILIGRSGGTDPNGPVNREGLQQYLRRSFLKNKPYDLMVSELVSAEGANRPGEPEFNGAVNFVLDNLAENAAPATAKSARIFLGLQVQCTQCHNHPFNEWKQDQFWSFNSFFRQAVALRLTDGANLVATRLADQDFSGEGSGGPDDGEIYYELRNGIMKMAVPVFVDGTAIDPSGYVEKVNRRDELARLIVESPYLSQAIVNRLWGHFLGYGFTKPVDDMGSHNLPSHPELLERLARDFAGHGHDFKSLVRWITLSEAYGLSSRVIPQNEADDPSTGVKPLFAHFYLRQMRAEELYHSLVVATGVDQAAGDYAAQERAKTEWLNQFTLAFGTDEGGEFTTFNGTIPQTLMMWNGELINRATSGQPGTLLHTVATTNNMKNTAKINHLFTAALARRPTKSELQAANQLWQLRGGDTLAAMQDLWWAVLNSNEFILNH